MIALKAIAVFASFNPFFNLFVFLKASLRVDIYHCMGQFEVSLMHEHFSDFHNTVVKVLGN